MSNHQLHNRAPLVARTIHRFPVPIILAWLAIIVILSVGVPSLNQVKMMGTGNRWIVRATNGARLCS